MNIFRNHQPAALIGAVSLLLLPAAQVFGQTTATTDPVGYTALSLPANSDSLISIPFTRPAVFTGAIGTAPGTGSTITVASSPGWTASQYKYVAGSQSNTYYAIIGPLLTGLASTVTVTNGSTTVTGSGFTPIVQGDELIVSGLAYNVASVTNDTTLVLSRAYTGTTASGLIASYDHSPKEGSYYTVTDNGTNTLMVNLNGDSLNPVATGTTVSLIPYWTLGTAFPASDAGISYIASSDSRTRATQIILPNQTSVGINLTSTLVYYNVGGTWNLAGATTTNVPNDAILSPSTYFTVRNTTSATTFTPTGSVYMNRLSIPLDTQTGGAQDNPVAVSRPAATTLNDLGLISSGAFTPSPNSRTRADQLLVYDNSVAGINKTGTVYYYDTAWHKASDSSDAGATLIPYGVGLVIRKSTTTSGATTFWQNTRNY